MLTTQQLTAIAAGTASEETLSRATEVYPYFTLPFVRQLRDTSDPDKRRSLKMRLAACIGDRDTLAILLGEEPEDFAAFYPDQRKPELTTDATIESFLDRFGDRLETHAEGGMVPVEAPAVDYASMLEREQPDLPTTLCPGDPTADVLENFFGRTSSAAPKEQTSQREETPRPSDPPTLTESLARIMIKNHNYSKALEIIEALSLNNPEKSIYFADQIRFLRKLIKIESIKQ